MAEKVRKVSEAELADALVKSGGIMAEAARLIEQTIGQPYTRQAVHERVKGSLALRDAVRAGRNELVDIAESKLWEMVKAGNEKAIFFVLETRGRRRGFEKSGDTTEDLKADAHNDLHIIYD